MRRRRPLCSCERENFPLGSSTARGLSSPPSPCRRGCLLPAAGLVLDEVDAACSDARVSPSAPFAEQPEVITVLSLFLWGS